jgi:hypothetical protein
LAFENVRVAEQSVVLENEVDRRSTVTFSSRQIRVVDDVVVHPDVVQLPDTVGSSSNALIDTDDAFGRILNEIAPDFNVAGSCYLDTGPLPERILRDGVRPPIVPDMVVADDGGRDVRRGTTPDCRDG